MEKLYHIGIAKDFGAKYAILPGDPGRAQKIAESFESPKLISQNREFIIYCGKLCGEKVLAASTGIGGPSAAIAVEELYMSGVRTFVRVGTCGGMQPNVNGGDLVIATAAVRAEGASKEYTPIEYPAVADFNVTSALLSSAKALGFGHHLGVVHSKDSFYGQHSPDRMPIKAQLKDRWDAWIKSGCLASEMECAALFTVSSVLKAQSGAVLSVLWNQQCKGQSFTSAETSATQRAIETAVNAVASLISQG